ncbi:MAG TPA: LysR substrate-binding domain-containing protein [Pseudonocardiaceae bacterium]|jgi:DNA-binding transcriptional LysR family regulator|nr:LysR substrate-binding domain-containing protein [Pseudonocardiaceae bacterium]
MFDPVLLRTFLVVAETRGFTSAAERLGLRQSTVSQHIRKLERIAGRTLLLRDTHSVELTGDGEAMIGFAWTILDGNERALAYFAGPELRGRLRFGASEDFVHGQLPDILRRFRRTHPLVDLELTVELSGRLHERLRAGDLDLVLAKRRPGEAHGELVWREKLVWIGAPDTRPEPGAPVPLIVYPPPSITRVQALDALRGQGRAWRIACTSASLNGLRAAALAGLGLTVFARSLIPAGLVEVAPEFGLPDPGEVEFVLMSRGSSLSGPAAALAGAIVADADRLHAPAH